jgi:ribosomal protein S12 methylthiotransferase accessory factor
MEIRFPGGMQVDALYGQYRIRTDQPVAQGGDGTAPSPFDLFLASLGTCAGFYALRFCQQRNLVTDGLELSVEFEKDTGARRVAGIRITVRLPHRFPEKYREAILRAIDQCTVKRHLADPPKISVVTVAKGEKASRPSTESISAAAGVSAGG